jgi:TonB family protein
MLSGADSERTMAIRRATMVIACAVGLALGCDTPDEPIERPAPMPGPTPFVYPVDLWDQKVQGETVLMVHVTELGAVDSVYVERTSGFSAFDSAATQGARRMRFSAGKRADKRVAMWTKVPVRFSMDTLATGAGAGPGSAR